MAGGEDEIEEPSAAGEVDRTAATTESLRQMTNLEWGKAGCGEDSIVRCVEAGTFRPGELVEWRAPAKDETPALATMEDQFIILSLTHIICGLRVDASDFLVSVLEHYKIEWSHLTPNSITALSIFAHLCEAYMSVPPTVEVFAHFYKLYPNMKGETTTLGGAYFRLRDKMKQNYPMYYLRASQFMWVSLWFYAKVPQSCRLTFRGHALKETNNWRDQLLLSHEQEEQVLRIGELSNQGLTGVDIVCDYLKYRISPLRRRRHLACDYTGPSDPTRDSDQDLSMEDIDSKLGYLLDLRKMGQKQPPNRPSSVPISLVRAYADGRANQPLGLLNVPSTNEAKKKAVVEITASRKTRKPSMITYKPLVRASLRRYTRQSAGPRKVIVPVPLETDSSPTRGHSDSEEEILDATTTITTAASPDRSVEQKSIVHPAEVEDGKKAELAKPALSFIGAKRKASAPRSGSQRKAKYSLLSIVTKTRMSTLDTGYIKGTNSTKEKVAAVNSQLSGLARPSPASLAEDTQNGALFTLANVVDQSKVVGNSMSNVLHDQPVRDSPPKEVDHALSIFEGVRDQDAIEESVVTTVHNMDEVNSEVIWEQMQKVQSEYVSLSVAASSKILEQGKKLVMDNKRLKDGQIELLEQEKKLVMENKYLKDRQITLEQQVKDLEDNRRFLTERMKKAEDEELERREQNAKLEDENKGQKQTIEELSKQNESTQGALVQKYTEVSRLKEEVAQLIKDKEDLQSRVSRANDLLKLMTSALCHEKDKAS